MAERQGWRGAAGGGGEEDSLCLSRAPHRSLCSIPGQLSSATTTTTTTIPPLGAARTIRGKGRLLPVPFRPPRSAARADSSRTRALGAGARPRPTPSASSSLPLSLSLSLSLSLCLYEAVGNRWISSRARIEPTRSRARWIRATAVSWRGTLRNLAEWRAVGG